MLRMFTSLQARFVSMRDREEGQALVEYALIVALIAVVCVTALTAVGVNISDKLTSIATDIANAGGGGGGGTP